MQNSTQIVNAAIQQVGDNQALVTGNYPNFDSSAAGIAAAQLYGQAVQTVAREFGWDFSRTTVALVASGNTPPFPWAAEYLYPASAIQIRQVMPAALADVNDPRPVDWVVANNSVSGTTTKVIQCNLLTALAVITNMPPEPTWDALFTEAVVRLLASELAMALEGRPETAREMLESSQQFTSIGERRDS